MGAPMDRKRTNKLDSRTRAALAAVLDHFMPYEEQHFVESGWPKEHIYRHLVRLLKLYDETEESHL